MKTREIKIYCPKCTWEPRQGSLWYCSSCEYMWNTFETAATCPECGQRHRETQCLSCFAHSLHSHWYHDFQHDEVEKRMVKAISAPITETH